MDVDRPGHPVTADTPTPAPAVPRFVWIVGALGLAFAVAGLVLWVVPSRAGEAQDSAADKAVISRVNDFATTYNTYDVADVDGYQERMSGLLTADYNADFIEEGGEDAAWGIHFAPCLDHMPEGTWPADAKRA